MRPSPLRTPTGTDALRADVLAGLRRRQKRIPCKYFYDERGSRLFERITTLPEYYLTRTETEILRRHATAIARAVGPGAALVEFGSGASVKTRILLDALRAPVAYVPIDICADQLAREASGLAAEYPHLGVRPVCADFTASYSLPDLGGARPVGFFPGSTLGNFAPPERRRFLRQAAAILGARAELILGLDAIKDPTLILAAYDDAAGVTAAFNLNLLCRLNRELGADFALDRFRHEARWDAARGCVAMHLASTVPHTVTVGGERFAFTAGETIHTEDSHKFDLAAVDAEVREAGWRVAQRWQDDRGWFGVFRLVVACRENK